ncbi:MAG: phage tail terminator family protein [Candidatus Heteroscillospira sp.]|jgi:hypothetical protein
METNDIIAAVTAEIGKIYPGETIYTDALPEGFERPCFAIECMAVACADVNRALVRFESTIKLTIFTAADELNERQSALLELFGGGRLNVSGRSVAVRTVKGQRLQEAADISAVFTWTDKRPGYTDPDVGDIPCAEKYELKG